ncbi:hypothetical protein BGW38_007530, partial [Lunasporangiospora selenospora]
EDRKRNSPALRAAKSERRPSFSITLPPPSSASSSLCSRNSSLVFQTVTGNSSENGDCDGIAGTALQADAGANAKGPQASTTIPTRKQSVQFYFDNNDPLSANEGRTLPKTPYPISKDEDERMRIRFLNH